MSIKKSIRNFKLEYLMLLQAVLWVIISCEWDIYTGSTIFFAKSGSIMILLAVIVEYRISGLIYSDLQSAMIINNKIDISIPLKGKPRKEKILLSRFAYTLIIVGTIISGYGDLLFW